LKRQLPRHDDAHHIDLVGAILHARLALLPRKVAGQVVGVARADGAQPELLLRQQSRARRTDELAVGDVVADKLLHRPGVQRLVVRLERPPYPCRALPHRAAQRHREDQRFEAVIIEMERASLSSRMRLLEPLAARPPVTAELSPSLARSLP
jgi:hypothetical protein